MNDLEKRLIELAKYGTPTLFCSSNTKKWSCSVDFSFKVAGVTTQVKSGFGHSTPLSAVKEVKRRIIEMVDQSSELKKLKLNGE